MRTTFIHTADWQLGKPFAGVRDEAKRSRLQQERIAVIGRIGEEARKSGAAFILVAGDMFDSATITRAVVSEACAAIGAIGMPVLVIPGNHDHGGPGSVWEQAFFRRERDELAPSLQVLLTPEPLELEGAIVFPCPLLRRHESIDPTAWVAASLGDGDGPGARPRIILAHGSVLGFGAPPEEEEDAGFPNLINLNRLADLPADYVALGDWHGTKSVGPRAWYSGTPELDRFPRGEDHRQGVVLYVTVEPGASPIVEPIVTSEMQWHDLIVRVNGDASLEELESRLADLSGRRAAQTLVRLALSGAVGIDGMRRLDERLESWEARLLDLRVDNQVSLAPTEAEIENLANRADDPLIARVAGKLLQNAADGRDPQVSMTALRALYALCGSDGTRGPR